MAESIIVHFAETEINKINKTFSEFSEVIGDIWYSPLNTNYLFQVYPYKDYFEEYEYFEQIEILKMLGCMPKYSFVVQLRRIQQNAACELAKSLIVDTLSDFNFVVDDCIDKIWSKEKIQTHRSEFLRHYYQ